MNTTEIATTRAGQFDLSPQTFEQALTFANYMADSDMVPKDFKGKPGNCLVAMQWGAEIGLKPMQALQNIAVINGRPALWGDSVIALVRASSMCEFVIETQTDTVASCRVKRRGEPEQERQFSTADAKVAGLLGKQGPWTQYPKRMMQMRARAFALRDVFPDVLKGLPVAEEVMDMPAERHMGMADVVKTEAPTSYPADKFAENLPAWRKVIADGRKTADQIIAFANTKCPLTAEQQAAIRAPTKTAATVSTIEERSPAEPVHTYAHVADRLTKASNDEQLADAADLIGSVEGEELRRELMEMYDARLAVLNK